MLEVVTRSEGVIRLCEYGNSLYSHWAALVGKKWPRSEKLTGLRESGELHNPSLVKSHHFVNLYSRMLVIALGTWIVGSSERHDDLKEVK